MLLTVRGIIILYNIDKVSLDIHRFLLFFLSKLPFCNSGGQFGDWPILTLNFENFKNNNFYLIDQIIILSKEEKSKSKTLSILQILEKQKSASSLFYHILRVLRPLSSVVRDLTS